MRSLVVFGLIVVGMANTGARAEAIVNTSQCSQDRVAVGGYDLISYRKPSGPKRGEVDITAE